MKKEMWRTNPRVMEGLIICPVGAGELITNPGVMVEQMNCQVMMWRTNPGVEERLIICPVSAGELITNPGV